MVHLVTRAGSLVATALLAWSVAAAAQAVDSSLWVPNGPVYTLARDGNTL